MPDVKEALVNRIFEVTRNLIAKHGFDNVCKEDIAGELEIDVNLIDNYFPGGKLAILRGLFQSNATEILEKADFNYVTIDNLAESLRFFLKLYIKAHRENATIINALEREFLANPERFEGYEDIFKVELTAAPLVAQVLRTFGFKAGKNFDDFVNLIIHTLDSLVHRHVLFEKIVEDDNVLIDFLISLSVGFIDYSIQIQNKKI